MWHFMRQFSNKTTVTRTVTLIAAGSGIYSFTSSSDKNNLLPLSLSRPNVPDPNMSEGAAPDSADSSKHSCNCLGRDDIANVAAKISPAIVTLTVPRGFCDKSSRKTYMGTGTIINEDGTILTCAHLVTYLSKGKIKVTLQDGRSFEGRVVNSDVHADVTIVKIKSKTPLPYAKLGSSGKLRPGDWVVAVGSPKGLHNTVTTGIVRISFFLVLDVDGEVVGINIMSGGHGLSLAVPVDLVAKLILHSNKNVRVVQPWLGLKMIDLNDKLIAYLKEVDASFPDVRAGVLIPMVPRYSPAYHAGFRAGDVLVEFGGKPITSADEVNDMVSDKVGHALEVMVKRAKNNVTKILSVIPLEIFSDI